MISSQTAKNLALAFFALLLLWGGYVFIMYAGIKEHFGHLLPASPEDNRVQDVLSACYDGDTFCQGLHAFLPSLLFTFERLAPFLMYIVVSVLGIGGWLIFRMVRAERSESPAIRVWTLVPLLLAAIWVLFSSLAGADPGRGAPLKWLVDPNSNYYSQRVDSETLQILRVSFNDLQLRGCLSPVPGTIDPPVYNLKTSCIQQSFFTLVLPAFLFILLVALDFLLLGLALLPLLKLQPRHLPFDRELLLALGLGVAGMVTVLWFLAVFGLIYRATGIILLLGIPLACYRQVIDLWRRLRGVRLVLPAAWGGWQLIAGWALITLFAVNFLAVIRPFPIGWDDLGSYLNRPHLLVEYGHFIPKMASFQWEYITSLGFWVFGPSSIFGAVTSMLLNWLAGVLAVLSLGVAGRFVLGRGGLLAALFYALLPMVGHFSFADMKIDNAVFLMTVIAFVAVFSLLFPDHEEGHDRADRRRWALLGGIFIGFAFGFKVTTAMSIFGLLFVMAGVWLGWPAMLGSAFVMLSAFMAQGTLKASAVLSRFVGTDIALPTRALILGGLVLAGLSFIFAIRRRPAVARPAFTEAGLFLIAILAVILPWVIHNNIYNEQWPPSFLFAPEDRLSPSISLKPDSVSTTRVVKTLPPALALDENHPACTNTGTAEELDRYWGSASGPSHYLLLPWRIVMNIDNGGYYVTTSALLLFLPLVLLMPAFWLRTNRRLRWLFMLTAMQTGLWVLLANGVLWYGLGMFIGVALLVEALLREAPDRRSRALMGVFVTISLLTSLGFRMWQFEMQAGSLEFVIGKVNADVVYAQTIPHYQQVAAAVVARAKQVPDRPYTLRMGTFIPYFIPRNPELVPNGDNQLDFFSCIAQENDPALITARLKAYGFNGLIFDLNTASIEQDPNGTLHQKVQRFLNYVANPASGVQAAVVDPAAGISYFIIP